MKLKFSMIATLALSMMMQEICFAQACSNLFEERCSLINQCSTTTIMDYLYGVVNKEPALVRKLHAANEATLKSLAKLPTPKVDPSRKAGLTTEEIQNVYTKVAKSDVASLSKYSKYDPQNKGIGFCFGRAMAAHLEALWEAKLDQKSIRKIWALGNLKSGGTTWGHHVATLVRHSDGTWYAIDPIFGEPMTADAWYAKMSKDFDPEQTLAVFTTEAKRFGPSFDFPYQKQELNSDFYNGFFVDLIADFKKRRTANESVD